MDCRDSFAGVHPERVVVAAPPSPLKHGGPRVVFCSVDEMLEMASTIKTEMLAELNATRKRLHQIASDSFGYNTLTNQVSSYRSTFCAKVKSHTSCRKQQQAENDVSMACAKCLNAMKVNRTLLCKKESLTADVTDLATV